MRVLPTLAVALLALVYAGISGSRGLGELYSRVVLESAQSAGAFEIGRAALEQAGRFAPWISSSHRAALRIGADNASSLLSTSSNNLRWSPADPYLWLEHSQVLALAGIYGEAHAVALRNAHRFAPASPTVQRLIAQLGLQHWAHGGAETRRQWLKGAEFTLRINGRRYLRQLVKSGNASRLCWTMAPDLGLETWCETYKRKGK